MNKLVIIQDNYPESPREWENLGKMVCFHNKYSLGDKHNYSSNDYNSWEEVKKAIIKNENVAVILPLYLYDHSGITISTSEFSCPWDSGQVGFIYVTKEVARNEFNVKKVSAKLKEKLNKLLESEVEVYRDYIEGNVYGFNIVDEDENIIDSCYGFYGNNFKDNGMLDYIDYKMLGLENQEEVLNLIHSF